MPALFIPICTRACPSCSRGQESEAFYATVGCTLYAPCPLTRTNDFILGGDGMRTRKPWCRGMGVELSFSGDRFEVSWKCSKWKECGARTSGSQILALTLLSFTGDVNESLPYLSLGTSICLWKEGSELNDVFACCSWIILIWEQTYTGCWTELSQGRQ